MPSTSRLPLEQELSTAEAVMSAGFGSITRTVGLGTGHLGDAVGQEPHLQQGLQPAAVQRHEEGGGGVVCQETQDCPI